MYQPTGIGILNGGLASPCRKVVIGYMQLLHYTALKLCREFVLLKQQCCEGKGLDTCYSATYMSQTGDKQRFTISEVAADWHMSQWCRSALCGHPLPALTNNWTHGAASRHTIAPISHTKPSPRSRSVLLISRPAEGRRLSWPEHTVG